MNRLVAIALPGGPQFVEELERAWDDGDAVFPVDLRSPVPVQKASLDRVAPAFLVDEDGRHRLENDQPVAHGDALVVPTSGTTNHPKAAVFDHEAVAASARLTSSALGVTGDDAWLACLPLSHIGGLSVITRSLITGTPVTVLPRFDADVVTAHARSGCSLVSLVAATLRRIDTDVFRKILLGGGPVPPDKPANAVATYGMTETGSGIVYDGYPLEGVQLRTDESSVLWVRSPTLLRSYRDGAKPFDDDGWFRTGDVGTIAADGKLAILGRFDDVIITGGEKVWPQAVEAVINRMAGVDAVLVQGEPDDEWGENIVAYIEDNGSNPTLEEVREHVKKDLPAYCAPRRIRVVPELKRTTSGKIRRSQND